MSLISCFFILPYPLYALDGYTLHVEMFLGELPIFPWVFVCIYSNQLVPHSYPNLCINPISFGFMVYIYIYTVYNIHIYIYIHIYRYTYIYIYRSTYIYIYIYTVYNIHMNIYIYSNPVKQTRLPSGNQTWLPGKSIIYRYSPPFIYNAHLLCVITRG